MDFADPQDFRTMEPWRIFRIMAEFVDGFEEMAKVQPAVSIFGSARTPPDHKHYKLGRELARQLAESGYNIITGGGPGIMEAANLGAKDAGKGLSIGLNIDLPFEQSANPHITKLLSFRYFFCRKVMFSKYSCAVIVLPGGFGTMDEFFENLTLVQTKKIPPMPVVLMGSEYWAGLLDWLKKVMLEEGRNISPGDMDLFHLTDSPEAAVQYVKANAVQPSDTVAMYRSGRPWGSDGFCGPE